MSQDVPPREVESVVNHRLIGGKHIVVGVSGGVSVDPGHSSRATLCESRTTGR